MNKKYYVDEVEYDMFDLFCSFRYEGLLTGENAKETPYYLAYKFIDLFGTKSTCGYISLIAYKLCSEYKELDYWDICTMCVVFLSERELTSGETNIELDENCTLRMTGASIYGFYGDLEFLRKSFNDFCKMKNKKVREYFVAPETVYAQMDDFIANSEKDVEDYDVLYEFDPKLRTKIKINWLY